jgi:predicted RNA-binding Zn ribbon-like protein
MDGERVASVGDWDAVWHEPSVPQPGGRERAPGALALVQSFINSHYDLELEHGADLFATSASLADWLKRRGLAPRTEAGPSVTRSDVRRAVAVREGLRALAQSGHGASPLDVTGAVTALNEAAHGLGVEVRFADGAPRFVAGAREGLERALGTVLAVTARAMIDGSWARLKVCPDEQCGWAFYDHSRNLSGRWCSMAVCGGRAKARAHYRRRRSGGE